MFVYSWLTKTYLGIRHQPKILHGEKLAVGRLESPQKLSKVLKNLEIF